MEEACRAVSEDDGGAGDKGGCHPVIIEDGDHKFSIFLRGMRQFFKVFPFFDVKS